MKKPVVRITRRVIEEVDDQKKQPDEWFNAFWILFGSVAVFAITWWILTVGARR
jgi:hypothetical protein